LDLLVDKYMKSVQMTNS